MTCPSMLYILECHFAGHKALVPPTYTINKINVAKKRQPTVAQEDVLDVSCELFSQHVFDRHLFY